MNKEKKIRKIKRQMLFNAFMYLFGVPTIVVVVVFLILSLASYGK